MPATLSWMFNDLSLILPTCSSKACNRVGTMALKVLKSEFFNLVVMGSLAVVWIYTTADRDWTDKIQLQIKPREAFNTLKPRLNGRHFADDIFKGIFLNENIWIPIEFSLKFVPVPRGPINNIPTLVQVMAWHRPSDKPLSEPMMVKLITHICGNRPQWVNASVAKSWWVANFRWQVPWLGRGLQRWMVLYDRLWDIDALARLSQNPFCLMPSRAVRLPIKTINGHGFIACHSVFIVQRPIRDTLTC